MGTNDTNDQVDRLVDQLDEAKARIKKLMYERGELLRILRGYEEERLAAERGEWINVDDALPEIGELVLLQEVTGTGPMCFHAFIGARTESGDSECGWLWAHACGQVYLPAIGKWAADDMEQDDIYPVRWCRIPVPPSIRKKGEVEA